MSEMIKKYSQKEFETLFNEVCFGEYELLSDYINMNEPITVKHLKENCLMPIFTAKASSIVNNGTGCPKCYGRGIFKRTTEEFQALVTEKKGLAYKVASEYTGALQPITMEHTDENGETHTYETTPQRVFNLNQRCTVCFGKMTAEKFAKKFHDRYGGKYTLLTEWTSSQGEITFRHENESCDYAVSTRSVRDVMHNTKPRTCRVCAEKRRLEWVNRQKAYNRIDAFGRKKKKRK